MAYNTTEYPVGTTVLYQAPGTRRSERVLAKVVREPTSLKGSYELDLGDGHKIECCWFSIDLPPRKTKKFEVSGVFGRDV